MINFIEKWRSRCFIYFIMNDILKSVIQEFFVRFEEKEYMMDKIVLNYYCYILILNEGLVINILYIKMM